MLDVFGLVRTQTGSGPQSGAIIVATPAAGMSAPMRLQVAARGFPVSHVVQTRLLLEPATVTELAGAPGVDLAPSAALLDTMDSDDLTAAEFLAIDARFHISLAEASGNQVVTTIMAGLRSSIEGYVLQGLPAIPDWPAETRQLRAEHRQIVDAVRAHDAAGAHDRIHAHISRYYTTTFASQQEQP